MADRAPFTVIVPTAYGQMLVNRNDINQTNSLFKTGTAPDHADILLLAHLLRQCPPNPTIVDVGANWGYFTLLAASLR